MNNILRYRLRVVQAPHISVWQGAVIAGLIFAAILIYGYAAYLGWKLGQLIWMVRRVH